MTNIPEPPVAAPKKPDQAWLFTWRGCVEGGLITLPLIPALTLFATAVGAAAAQKGLDLAQLMAMNAFVYAGQSQLVALGLWHDVWNWPSLLAIALVTFTVNARMILMGASLHPWLGTAPRKLTYTSLFFLTDANWIIAQRYYAQNGRDIGVFLGAGLALWVVWLVAPIPGFLIGKLVLEPRLYALDLVMPVFFIAMVARLWKSNRDTFAWSVAAITGVIVSKFLGGGAHVVAGALMGMAAAMALPPKSKGAA